MSLSEDHHTVGRLVAEHPQLMRVFESVGVDYCCGGHLSLEQACAESGCDIDEVRILVSDALVDTAHDPDHVPAWTDLDMMGLVEHIERTHHEYLKSELPRLTELIDKVVNAHVARHPELVEVREILLAFIADMNPHLAKEERILFPIVREIALATEPTAFHCGSVGNPIGMMRYEHEQVGEMLESLRRLTNGYTAPDDACASYTALYEGLAVLESDTHLHIHKENNILFPSAIEAEGHMNQISPMS